MRIRNRRRVAAGTAGLMVGLLAILAGLAGLRPEAIDRVVYDALMRVTADPSNATDRLVIVNIDEESLGWVTRDFGFGWPWPREFHGELLGALRRWGAREVAFDVVFGSQQGRGEGWGDLKAFSKAMQESGGVVLAGVAAHGSVPPPSPRGQGLRLKRYGSRAEAMRAAAYLLMLGQAPYLETLQEGPTQTPPKTAPVGGATFQLWSGEQTDALGAFRTLAAARSGLLPESGPGVAASTDELEAWVAQRAPQWTAAVPPDAERLDSARFRQRFRLRKAEAFIPGIAPILPAPLFLEAASGLGIATQTLDEDGVLRSVRLTASLPDGEYPSFPLAIYQASLRSPAPVSMPPGQLKLGEEDIDLNQAGRVLVRYHGVSPYEQVAAWQVLRSAFLESEGKDPLLDTSRFQGKIVIVSPSAPMLADHKPGPMSANQNGSDINAAVVDGLIANRFMHRAPQWLMMLSTLLISLFAALLAAFASEPHPLKRVEGLVGSTLRLSVRGLMAGVALSAVLGPLVLVAWFLFGSLDLWIPIATPTLSGVAGLLASLGVLEYLEYRDRHTIHEALGIYTSGLVANLVASGGVSALDPRRDDITVLFSDIEGFTTISEQLSPERLATLLGRYLTAMTDVILAHEGIVDKYIGDAIMAFWGWRETQADHPVRAVRCALAMEARLKALRPELEKEYGVLLKARVGLNSGVAVVGNFGSAQKMDVTLLGDVVNLASRLEGANKTYGTYLMLGEGTHARVAKVFEMRELDLLRVKGKLKPVRVFEALEERDEGEPLVGPSAADAEAGGPGPTANARTGASGLPASHLAWRDRFEEGVRAFRQGDFEVARACFLKVQGLRPEDPPTEVYLERCAQLLKHPPDGVWDGVFVMQHK